MRLVVAQLPDTFGIFEELLSDFSSPLWHEVHFTAICNLERGELSGPGQPAGLCLVLCAPCVLCGEKNPRPVQ